MCVSVIRVVCHQVLVQNKLCEPRHQHLINKLTQMHGWWIFRREETESWWAEWLSHLVCVGLKWRLVQVEVALSLSLERHQEENQQWLHKPPEQPGQYFSRILAKQSKSLWSNPRAYSGFKRGLQNVKALLRMISVSGVGYIFMCFGKESEHRM